MHNEKSISIKEEQTDEMCAEQTTMFLGDPLGGYWSTDHLNGDSRLNFGWDENKNSNADLNILLHTILEAESECCPPPLLVPEKELFPDYTLRISWLSDFIKEDPELNLEADETENIALKDPLDIGGTSLHVKQERELKHLVDGCEHNVAASTGSESGSTRLIQHSSESCYISSQEIVKQEVVPGEPEIGAGESTSFTMFGICTQQKEEEEQEDDRLFGIRLKCSLREKLFHKFSCSFCLQSFPSKYRLIMHVFNHIDGVEPPTYVCKSCGEVFRSNISLNRHMKNSVGVQAPFDGHNYKTGHIYNHEKIMEGDQEVSFMEQTDKQSSNKETRRLSMKFFNDNYKTHIMTSDAEKRDRHDNYGSSSVTVDHRAVKLNCECDVCGKTFTQMEHLKRHGLIHAAVSSNTCNICGKSFTMLGTLKNHSLIHSGLRPHKCDICGKSFTDSSTLKKHSLIHTGIRPHKCDICGKSFTRSSHLKQHSLIHTGKKPHKCDICGKCFTQSGALKLHSLIHTEAKPHKCDICGKPFKRSSDVKLHSIIHTGSKPHKCVTCTKSFTFLSNLKTHSLIHTGLKPHKCDICGKHFRSLGALKSHSLIHTGLKLHKCETCSKSFARLGELKSHSLVHTGSKPHRCDICGKSFSQLHNFKRHSLLHTGSKVHKCDICDRSFTLVRYLKRHSLMHTGSKAHKCEICGKSFTRLSNLRKHSLKHTG